MPTHRAIRMEERSRACGRWGKEESTKQKTGQPDTDSAIADSFPNCLQHSFKPHIWITIDLARPECASASEIHETSEGNDQSIHVYNGWRKCASWSSIVAPSNSRRNLMTYSLCCGAGRFYDRAINYCASLLASLRTTFGRRIIKLSLILYCIVLPAMCSMLSSRSDISRSFLYAHIS